MSQTDQFAAGPQLDSPLTRVKPVLVLLIALNGVHTGALLIGFCSTQQ